MMTLGKQLLEDLTELLQGKRSEQRKWLKSSDVSVLLQISPGTLQNLRIQEALILTKVGGSFYYSYQNVQHIPEPGIKVHAILQKFNNGLQIIGKKHHSPERFQNHCRSERLGVGISQTVSKNAKAK